MKKRILGGVLIFLVCLLLVLPASAETIPDTQLLPLVVDNADLLTAGEEAELLAQLEEISQRLEFDVVVVTTNSTDGKSVQAYADDFYDYNGYGYGTNADGVLLLISMEDRDWYISTCGYGITAFTDDGIQYIGDEISGDLGDGYYADAFERFGELCDEFVQEALKGDVVTPREKLPWTRIPLSLLIGAAIALIPLLSMKGKLKTVRRQAAAANYIRQDSFQLTQSRDVFLYRNVSRRARPKNNSSGGSSTHSSSSGRSHGGGGGKF